MIETKKQFDQQHPHYLLIKIRRWVKDIFRGGIENIPSNELTIVTQGSTEENPYKKRSNEDDYFTGSNFAGVLDGIGGLVNGTKSAKLAAKIFKKELEAINPNGSVEEVMDGIKQVFLNANKEILQSVDGIEKRTGATAAIVFVRNNPLGGKEAIVAHMGDCRVYLFRGGKLIPLTIDDNPGIYLIGNTPKERMKLQIELANIRSQDDLNKLTEKQRVVMNDRNTVLAALGLFNVCTPNIQYPIQMMPGDKFICSTDGLHDNIPQYILENIAKTHGVKGNLSQILVNEAIKAMSDKNNVLHKPDDVTVAVLDIFEEPTQKIIPYSENNNLRNQEARNHAESNSSKDLQLHDRILINGELNWIVTKVLKNAAGETEYLVTKINILKNGANMGETRSITNADSATLKKVDINGIISKETDLDQLKVSIQNLGCIIDKKNLYSAYFLLDLISRYQAYPSKNNLFLFPTANGLRAKVESLKPKKSFLAWLFK